MQAGALCRGLATRQGGGHEYLFIAEAGLLVRLFFHSSACLFGGIIVPIHKGAPQSWDYVATFLCMAKTFGRCRKELLSRVTETGNCTGELETREAR